MSKQFLDVNDVLRLLRREVERAGGQYAWSRHTGVNRAYLYRVMDDQSPPGGPILAALKLKKISLVKKTDIVRLVQHEVQRAGSQAEWARRAGVSRVNLNLVINGRRRPNVALLKALKLTPFAYTAAKKRRTAPSTDKPARRDACPR
jgi:DNA-binding phage protein